MSEQNREFPVLSSERCSSIPAYGNTAIRGSPKVNRGIRACDGDWQTNIDDAQKCCQQ